MSKFDKLALVVFLGSMVIISWTFWQGILYFFTNWKAEQQHPLVLVRSTQGDAIGVSVNEGAIFRGIPYSQPPTGEYRWKHPRNFTSFPNNPWNATYYRYACMQICDQPAEFYACPQTRISEDCLYLNVWVPRRALRLVKGDDAIKTDHYVISDEFLHNDNASFGVMLFIHGGSYLDGAGSAPMYDSRKLANFGDVIVVTINYRLGPWGYLVHGNLEGNFGIQDQIQALSWVKHHIHSYGGDSNKITVFGQSAGAQSIAVLLTSPMGKGMFNQAIMQSTYLGAPFPNTASSKRQGKKFIQALGCPLFDMTCLQNMSTEKIMSIYIATKDNIPWEPVIGGNFLPKQPVDAFALGEVEDMPIIMGGTVDESTMFIADYIPHILTDTEYDELLMEAFKLNYFGVHRRYPPVCPLFDHPTPPCDNRPELSKLSTDYTFICPQRRVLQHLNYSSKWFYVFNQTWSFYEAWELPQCFDHVCHSADLVFVFNADQSIFSLNSNEKKLSQRMQKYWTNFARFGNPNGCLIDDELFEEINWPEFSPERNSRTYKALQFRGMGDYIMKSPYNSNCNFWDEMK